MKKILAFTSIRSDYDLLSTLYGLLDSDEEIDFRLLVAGAHLSKAYGNSVTEIEKDGFNILMKLETLLNSDSPQSRIKSASILLINSIDIINNFKPDLIIVCGDREDVIIGALIGVYLNISVLHFFGGDQSENSFVDNPVRHATSMMSNYHMVSLDEHKKRLCNFGIKSCSISVIGNPALDRFMHSTMMSRVEISETLETQLVFKNFGIVIFHPFDESKYSIEEQISNLINAIQEKGIPVFFSYPNVDPGNEDILSAIRKLKNDKNVYIYKNLSREIFISLYKFSSLIIGNSSSGILEAASIPVPAIDIGNRQKGRICSQNVIRCSCDTEDISKALDLGTSEEFIESITNMKNIYGDGNSSNKAYSCIKQILS